MYTFYEKDTRDGISYISNRYRKANNKYLKSYDPKKESKYIIYLDANNLYGCAISNFLSTSRFKWIDPKVFNSNKYDSNSPKVYVLEVDLEYPIELRKLHKDYSLAPVKTEIKREILYESQLNIADLYNIPFGNVKKLIPDFFDKEKYVLHHENLQLYLKLGLKFKKLYRLLEFNQSQWLKQFIEFRKRKKNRSRKFN